MKQTKTFEQWQYVLKQLCVSLVYTEGQFTFSMWVGRRHIQRSYLRPPYLTIPEDDRLLNECAHHFLDTVLGVKL